MRGVGPVSKPVGLFIRCAGRGMLVLVCVAGCGGDAPDAAGGEAETAAAASESAPDASAAGEAKDACALIEAEEIAAIVGEPVTARAEAASSNQTACMYESSATKTPLFGITVTWSGGREAWEIQQSGTALASDVMGKAFANEGVDVDSIVQPGPVAGLGDAAVFSDLMPSAILEGDTMIEILVTFLPDPERHFVPLGRKALARM